jgi:SAM-dependent methyltransferase
VPDIARGFRDVDSSGEPSAFVEYLDGVRDDLVDLQRRAAEALGLRAGDPTLDVGCGTGEELRSLAQIVGTQGRVVGIDRSERLVEEARAERGRTRSSRWWWAMRNPARSRSFALFPASWVREANWNSLDPSPRRPS